jgi:hypothetical protein
MRRPSASMLGDAADDAEAPPTLQASGGAPPPLAGAKKSLGDPGGPSKLAAAAACPLPSCLLPTPYMYASPPNPEIDVPRPLM